jgi:hypothetical protein
MHIATNSKKGASQLLEGCDTEASMAHLAYKGGLEKENCKVVLPLLAGLQLHQLLQLGTNSRS